VLRLQQVRACVLDDATLGQVQNAECDLSHWEIATIPIFRRCRAVPPALPGPRIFIIPVQTCACRRSCGVLASTASIPSGLASRRRVARTGSSERNSCVI
jgi:hypothetical protein